MKFSCEKAESKYNCLINKQTDYLLGIVIILLVIFIWFMKYISNRLESMYSVIDPERVNLEINVLKEWKSQQ